LLLEKIAKSSKIKGFNVYFFLSVPVSESNHSKPWQTSAIY